MTHKSSAWKLRQSANIALFFTSSFTAIWEASVGDQDTWVGEWAHPFGLASGYGDVTYELTRLLHGYSAGHDSGLVPSCHIMREPSRTCWQIHDEETSI